MKKVLLSLSMVMGIALQPAMQAAQGSQEYRWYNKVAKSIHDNAATIGIAGGAVTAIGLAYLMLQANLNISAQCAKAGHSDCGSDGDMGGLIVAPVGFAVFMGITCLLEFATNPFLEEADRTSSLVELGIL